MNLNLTIRYLSRLETNLPIKHLDVIAHLVVEDFLFCKEIFVLTSFSSLDFELLHLQLMINGIVTNFICSYKPPSDVCCEYLSYVEDFLFSLNMELPLFIVGDLNMDLLSDRGSELSKFLYNNSLRNFVDKPTRTATVKSWDVSSSCYVNKTSSTLIDVIIHNAGLVQSTDVFDCPFSDHKFVCASLKIDPVIDNNVEILGRNLSAKKLIP